MKTKISLAAAAALLSFGMTQPAIAEGHHEEFAHEIERIELEVAIELATNESEQAEISRQLKRIHLLKDRLQDKRHQTRDELFHVSHPHQGEHEDHYEGEHDEEHEEFEGEHNEAEEIEAELHHLRKEIEDLREAGKHDRAEQVEVKARELIEELKKREHRKRGPERAEFRQRFEQLKAERREVIAHLEELSEVLERFEGEGEEAEAERDELEKRTDEVESHLNELNKKLERLEEHPRE
jgi:chromosome segregation ATPase